MSCDSGYHYGFVSCKRRLVWKVRQGFVEEIVQRTKYLYITNALTLLKLTH